MPPCDNIPPQNNKDTCRTPSKDLSRTPSKDLYRLPSKDLVQWFVVHVKWRREEEFEAFAASHGLTTFVARRYDLVSGRGSRRASSSGPEAKTRRAVVVIPEVVFVRASFNELQPLLDEAQHRLKMTLFFGRGQVDGARRILTVPLRQMENFMLMARQMEADVAYLRPEEVSLAEGDRVRVHGGPFDGVEGVLARVSGRRSRQVVVCIDGLAAVGTQLSPDYIEVLAYAKRDRGPQADDIDALKRESRRMMEAGDVAGDGSDNEREEKRGREAEGRIKGEAEGEAARAARRKNLRMLAERIGRAGRPRQGQEASVALAMLLCAKALADAEAAERWRGECLRLMEGMKECRQKEEMRVETDDCNRL